MSNRFALDNKVIIVTGTHSFIAALAEEGAWRTKGHRSHRFGEPSELTGALTWLLSDAASFVNGASIVVNGGFTVFCGLKKKIKEETCTRWNRHGDGLDLTTRSPLQM